MLVPFGCRRRNHVSGYLSVRVAVYALLLRPDLTRFSVILSRFNSSNPLTFRRRSVRRVRY